MKFIYEGCEGAPNVSTHYGVKFTIGEPAEVSDGEAIAKLNGHPHFRAVSEKAEQTAAAIASAASDAEPAGGKKAGGKKAGGKKAGGKKAAE